MPHFVISQNKGFQIKFANGLTVSVQFGPYNYCANRDMKPQTFGPDRGATPVPACADAEVAVLRPSGDLVPMQGAGDDVRGWVTPSTVVRLLAWAERQSADAQPAEVPASIFADDAQ